MSDNNTSDTDPFREQQSTADATSQLRRWITPGMTIPDAMKKLESQGFTCQLTLPQTKELTPSALCTYQTLSSPPTEQRIASLQTPASWIVTLDSKDGTTVGNLTIVERPRR